MRLAVYSAVLAIALGSVLFGLDWLSAPMSPMVNTDAGLRAVAPPQVPAPVVATPTPVAPKTAIGAPIVPPRLVSPATPNAPTPPGAAAQVAPQGSQAAPQESIASPEAEVPCNIDACTAAYRSFRASDCTYLPTGGPRKLCTK